MDVKPIEYGEALTINVGGIRQIIGRGTLTSIPNSFMSQYFSQIAVGPDGRYTGEEIFIDRDPDVFAQIINYLRSDRKFIPKDVNVDLASLFELEVRYW